MFIYICGSGRNRTSNVYPEGRDLQSLTSPPSTLHSHRRHLITTEVGWLTLFISYLLLSVARRLTDLWSACIVEMSPINPILLKVITGSYSLLSQTRCSLQGVLLSPTAAFLVVPSGFEPEPLV